MALVTIDSSVYLSAFNQTDVFFKESENFFEKIYENQIPIVLPILVPFEILNILKKNNWLTRLKRDEIFKSFFTDAQTTIIDLNYSMAEIFMNLNDKFKLKTSDAIIAVTSLSAKSYLISWDKSLVKSVSKISKALTPIEYIKML